MSSQLPSESANILRAAVSISAILTSRSIPHALIGGLALLLHSSTPYRSTKDVDIIVSTTKSALIALLSYDPSTWILIPQARDDYVAFFYRPPGTTDLVLVELFTDAPGKKQVLPRTVKKLTRHSPLPIPLLHPAALFKGKLSAAASRRKTSDMFDVLFLCTSFPEDVRMGAKRAEKTVLAAVQRWPQLKLVLERAGVRVPGRSGFGFSRGRELRIEAKIPVGGVQRGLGCAW